MKKNIIRLTEAQLKQYISKVIAEQAVPAAAAAAATPPATGNQFATINQALVTAVKGKNIQLYGDAGKTKKGHLVQVVSINMNQEGRVAMQVKDLAFVSQSGAKIAPADNSAELGYLIFDCKYPEYLAGYGVDRKSLSPFYCPSVTQLLDKTAGCQKVSHTADFASTGGGTKTDFA